MLEHGKIIPFNKIKYFKYIRPLGSGGTGDTHLFEDETTNTLFAIKKYSPKKGNDIEENYERFVQEVKILFNISHKNIVRIYSHYLYPEHKNGYLQMEYVNGKHINEFTPYHGREWNDIFFDIIEAFCYLERNKILHRDIRPENIFIDINGDIKIIDFGFGKKLEYTYDVGDSIFLNWQVSALPNELADKKIYNHQTEIYFLGNLFKKLNLSHGTEKFYYVHILEKMCEQHQINRYKNFKEILNDISKGAFIRIQISQEAKYIYQAFASCLTSAIAVFKEELVMEREPQKILSSLSEVLRISSFEDYIQENSSVICSIIKQPLTYYNPPHVSIEVEIVRKFCDLFSSIPKREQEILLDNLEVRLRKIKLSTSDDMDNIPF
jgi:serine/threonine-protein kinase